MATTITESSHELMEKIVRKEFDLYPKWWQKESAKDVINTAREYHMRTEFINELLNDL